MKWYHLLACFFAGLFLANAIPHFVHGISGDSVSVQLTHPPKDQTALAANHPAGVSS